jgi:transposase
MKPAYMLLEQWGREDPPQLLQAALRQAQQIEELAAEVVQLRGESAFLREEITLKNKRLSELEKALEEATRAAHRQAAPFRVREEKRASAPKKPGRKAGHPGSFRHKPDHIDEEITVELCACPHCGGTQFCEQSEVEQIIEEIPPIVPKVTRLRTYEATCAKCGEPVRSGHPLQTSNATGAAGVHLGPRALALATDLNKAKGLSMRKTCAVLADCFGLALSPGGLAHAVARMAGRLLPQYQALTLQLRQAPVVHADETSWWVGARGWWLWVFTHQQATLYLVGQSRGRDVVHEVLGADYPGVLVSDCLSVYDEATAHQHKCYAHHHRAIAEASKIHPENGCAYLNEAAALLRAATALKAQKPQMSSQSFQTLRARLQNTAHNLLESPRSQPQEESVRRRLFKQQDHLFTFLDHDQVDATNNLAERQLRPAVIARKISCGNKTPKGARTWQILASIAATCTQQRRSFIATLARAAPLRPP